jgi:hypothetical protein
LISRACPTRPPGAAWGESEGQIRVYLRRSGGGSEFRNNDEMRARWFRSDGTLDEARVSAAPDVYRLITPSASRALALNKAYRVIVMDQSFLLGRDPVATPPTNVLREVDTEVAPLAPEFRYAWDLRVAWPFGN